MFCFILFCWQGLIELGWVGMFYVADDDFELMILMCLPPLATLGLCAGCCLWRNA